MIFEWNSLGETVPWETMQIPWPGDTHTVKVLVDFTC